MAHFEEAYAIATRITITGDAEKKLQSFWRAIRRTNEALEVLNKRLRPINDQITRLDQLTGKLNPKMHAFREALYGSKSALNSLNNSFSTLGDRTLSSINRFDKFNIKTASSIAKVDALSAKVRQLSANMEGLNAATAHSRTIGGAISKGRKSAPEGGGASVHARNMHLGPFGYNPGSIAISAAAYGAYNTVKGSYQADKEYQKTLAQFDLMGFGDSARERAVRFAFSNQEKGISPTSLLKSLTDAAQVLKDPVAAEKIAPMLARAEFANSSIIPNYNHAQNRDLVRAAEMYLGTKDPEKLKPVLDTFQKVISSSGGRVLPTQFLNFMQTGGIAAKNMALDTFYMLEPIIQEAGGHRAGTGLTSIQRQLQSGSMTQSTAERLSELGILDKTKLKYNKVGSIKKVLPGAVLGSDALSNNVVAWFEGVYLPQLAKHGITAKKDILNEINYDFGNRTGAALAGLIDVSLEKAILSAKVSPKAMGVDESFKKALSIPTGSEKALTEALNRFETALGKFTSPAILNAMDRLTGFLDTTAKLLETFSDKDATAGQKKDAALNYGGKIVKKIYDTSGAKAANDMFDSTAKSSGRNSMPMLPSGFGMPTQITVPPPASAQKQAIQLHSRFDVDGRKLFEGVTMYQVNELNKPQTGTSSVNPRVGSIQPGMNMAR